MFGDELLKLLGQRGKPLRQLIARRGGELTVGEVGKAVAVGLDQPPAGRAETWIEAEDFHARLASSSSGIFSLPQTVCTSSSSSSASMRFASFCASPPRT